MLSSLINLALSLSCSRVSRALTSQEKSPLARARAERVCLSVLSSGDSVCIVRTGEARAHTVAGTCAPNAPINIGRRARAPPRFARTYICERSYILIHARTMSTTTTTVRPPADLRARDSATVRVARYCMRLSLSLSRSASQACIMHCI